MDGIWYISAQPKDGDLIVGAWTSMGKVSFCSESLCFFWRNHTVFLSELFNNSLRISIARIWFDLLQSWRWWWICYLGSFQSYINEARLMSHRFSQLEMHMGSPSCAGYFITYLVVSNTKVDLPSIVGEEKNIVTVTCLFLVCISLIDIWDLDLKISSTSPFWIHQQSHLELILKFHCWLPHQQIRKLQKFTTMEQSTTRGSKGSKNIGISTEKQEKWMEQKQRHTAQGKRHELDFCEVISIGRESIVQDIEAILVLHVLCFQQGSTVSYVGSTVSLRRVQQGFDKKNTPCACLRGRAENNNDNNK